VIAAFGLAAAVLASGSRLVAAAGAGFALATLGGYLLSVWTGLFGFKEIRTTAGIVAGVIEVAAFAAMAALAAAPAAAGQQAGRALGGGRLPARLQAGIPGAGPAVAGRPGVPVAALVTVLAAAGATWYGFLAHTRSHPTVRLAGALALAADGLAAVLLATPPLQQPAVPMPGGPVPSAAATQAEGTHPSGTLLGLLSMAAALIHFSVIEQHWTEYWLYGAFFIAVGLAQLGRALAIPAAPVRWLLYGGVLGNALVVITWIVTRTVGSLVGPAATMPARAGSVT